VDLDQGQDGSEGCEKDEPDWVIQLRPLGSAAPAEVRIRRLLKLALRGLGLRCVSMSWRRRGEAAEPVKENSDAGKRTAQRIKRRQQGPKT
jgi:hypothetical protein